MTTTFKTFIRDENIKRFLVKTVLIAMALIFSLIFAVFAQEKTQPGQVTFLPPIGTHGTKADSISFYASFNILVGKTGGIKAIEFGGVSNITKGDVNGAQFAGISNIVTGQTNAIQSSGIVNVTHGLQGAQFAGITNVNRGQAYGLQVAGISNEAQDVNGAQIAGILNHAHKLSGFQLALINVVDSLDGGVPLGLFSIVKKNGYRAVEISHNDAFLANVAVKSGAKSLYNTYHFRYTDKDNVKYYGLGLGLGALVPVTNQFSFNIDINGTQVNIDEWWTNELNMINRFELSANLHVARYFTITGGFALNVSVSQLKDEEGMLIGNPLVPEQNFYEHISNNTITTIYPGFNIGIRF